MRKIQIRPDKVCGIGINDSPVVVERIDADGKHTACIYYLAWRQMLVRVANEKFQARSTAYIDCTVCDEWIYFSNFKAWAEKQGDITGLELDKDIIQVGNKHYSPETCCFVSQELNKLIGKDSFRKNGLPRGTWRRNDSKSVKYRAGIGINGKTLHLGTFNNVEDAAIAYNKAKAQRLLDMSDEQSDYRIRGGLIRHAAHALNGN